MSPILESLLQYGIAGAALAVLAVLHFYTLKVFVSQITRILRVHREEREADRRQAAEHHKTLREDIQRLRLYRPEGA